jgi:hypothetical protein
MYQNGMNPYFKLLYSSKPNLTAKAKFDTTKGNFDAANANFTAAKSIKFFCRSHCSLNLLPFLEGVCDDSLIPSVVGQLNLLVHSGTMTLSITAFCIEVLFATLSITTLFHYVKCHILFISMLNVINLNVIMLSVIRLSVIRLSVIRLSVIMLSVIILNVVMLHVMAPYICTSLGQTSHLEHFSC